MERAQANLRTALWRIRQADPGLIATAHDRLQLGPSVRVDVHESPAQTKRLLSETDEPLAAEDSQVEPLVQDLLPGWDDDWLLLERERVRQIHMHALEALATREVRYEQILWDELRLSPLHTFEQLRILYGAASVATARSGAVSRPGAK